MFCILPVFDILGLFLHFSLSTGYKYLVLSCFSCVRLCMTLWLLCPQNSSGKNTGFGCHSLFQRIFPTQGSNLGLLHCRQTLYSLSYRKVPLTVV